MALVLTIGGYNRTTLLVHESLTVNQTNDGLNSTCEFDLIDKEAVLEDIWTVEHSIVEGPDRIYMGYYPQTKVEVYIDDGAMRYFGGILSRVTISHLGTTTPVGYDEARMFHCACHDFNQMIEESVVDEVESYGAKLDNFIIDDIFDKYVTGIDYTTHVAGGAYVFDEIFFDDMTVRQVLDIICAQSECVWYVDYHKRLHYALVEANTLTWWLSDQPDDVDSFEYFNGITKEVDATNLVNQVFVVGGPVALWFVDALSIAAYGKHKAIVRDTSLIDIDDIEAYGNAILTKYKDPIATYTLATYHNENDLRAGKHIRLINALYGVDGTFLINSLTITFPVDGSPEYHLVLGGIESSMSGSVQRLTLDKIHRGVLPISPSQLPIASRGWGHDLVFTAVEDDKVEWTGGDITTAGGIKYAIAAGDTGNMAQKTIVYLDLDIIDTELRTTTDELAAIGTYRIMVAVCWKSGIPGPAPAEVMAGFQVFGASSGGAQTFLNADNIVGNSITANELAANSVIATKIDVVNLEAVSADMGTLTAGTIQTAGAGNTRVVINIADGIVGYDALDVVQFQLDPADGIAKAGAGTVILDEDGLSIDGGTVAPNFVKWIDGAITIGKHYGFIAGNNYQLWAKCGPPALAAGYSDIEIEALAVGALDDASITIRSEATGSGAVVRAKVGAFLVFSAKELYLHMHRPIRFDDVGVPAAPADGIILFYDTTGAADTGLWIKYGDNSVKELASV